ncbi:Aminopeptidase B [Acipenser ruthenus]|uniref:Aminopeptidase B n=1 Tax=Acipenser ruthenus TaxID=7906 RepID=A0A444U289_ACIRT|nr:Aminopeptidase B [Acipenser ruthenus]
MSDFQRPTLCCCRKVLSIPNNKSENSMPAMGQSPPVDIASASNFHSFTLRHFHLSLQLNFRDKEMTGRQVLELCSTKPDTQTLVLDTHQSLLIHSIDCKVHSASGDQVCTSLTYRVDPFTDYGSSLTISLPAAIRPQHTFQIIIRYKTTDGPAIWWLDSELTCGNSKPFVFTQGHSVCNRSFFPCFDTPAVKCTYSATVRVPEGVQVLMSATRSAYSAHEKAFQFHMEYPVPAYLVALVAGDLTPADIGPRSRIWAEPCLLNAAVSKLSGLVERWLTVAESLFGPYVWGSSEFLVIDVIHEIAHGWFGNAVTNATWEEMWLSEGLATYAQRRITTEAYGVNPSSLMNLFTYEKGYCFVSYLSQLCGDTKRFDSFLRAYIEKFKFTSVVAHDLLEFFLGFFPELKERCVANREEVMTRLSRSYSTLLDSMNAEVRIRWLQIVVRNSYYPDLCKVRRFLESHTSRMYTVPLYEDLCGGTMKSFAVEVFYQTQARLHINLRRTVQQILAQTFSAFVTVPTAPPSGDRPPDTAIALRDVNVLA